VVCVIVLLGAGAWLVLRWLEQRRHAVVVGPSPERRPVAPSADERARLEAFTSELFGAAALSEPSRPAPRADAPDPAALARALTEASGGDETPAEAGTPDGDAIESRGPAIDLTTPAPEAREEPAVPAAAADEAADEPAVEAAPVEEAPVEETPVEAATAEEATAEEAPVGEATAVGPDTDQPEASAPSFIELLAAEPLASPPPQADRAGPDTRVEAGSEEAASAPAARSSDLPARRR